ncbi:MAG TPA: M23 family metallopeptidase, partial [Polyangiaceae bacterium LLY-WYZ-15_(1-7)]|nr:M23 family metallopeptidase [Polyangiaceae bacterium LLY-WYZ-15_(1-7)]
AARAEATHDDLEDEDEGDGEREGRRRRFDYSRFSDGPRRVPEPRGASQRRAEALGLGTTQTASRLFHAAPDPRWVEAARGEMPEHLQWPVELGRFGRGFGYVRRTRPDLRHNGLDIVADEGSVVRAVADGIVAYSDNGVRGMGNLVMIVHPDASVSIYAHNYRTTVQPGWRVRRGERIAFVGTTGISRGPHLHFEVRRRGRPIDPLHLFDGRPWIDAYRAWRAARADGTYAEPTDHLRADLPPDRGPAAAGGAVASRSPGRAAPVDGDVGEVGFVRRLLREGASAADLEEVEGRHFRNVLWPVRGGERLRREGRGLNVVAEPGAPVRAIADGLVVYVGEELRGLGKSIAILHPNGWISLYGSNAETHVEVGQQVLRGSWIARVGDTGGGRAHLHFQLREGGEVVDPMELLVQVPDAI